MMAMNWREGNRDSIILAILVLSVLLLNSGLDGVLYRDHSLLEQNLNDGLVLLVGGWVGLRMARRMSLPLWWGNPQPTARKGSWLLLVAGTFIVGVNTWIHFFTFRKSAGQYLQMQPWMESMDLWHAVFLSARAAITEEVLFRLLAIGILLWLLEALGGQRKRHGVIAMIVSSLLFGWMHASFLIPFFFGLVLSTIYFMYGLIPVMAIHFLANLLPFSMIAMGWFS